MIMTALQLHCHASALFSHKRDCCNGEIPTHVSCSYACRCKQFQNGYSQGEMLRWRQQAQLAAAAVVEAKNELLERRRELGATNERMDSLVEKLYVGRDMGAELGGAIGG